MTNDKDDLLEHEIGSPEWEHMMKQNEGLKEKMDKESAERTAKYRKLVDDLVAEFSEGKAK